ncbi:MAG: hypothetical protein D6772_13105 [Bacteroidetes bacterium]|nr:MAG: hypothetical protein D6772_13105 [Bacteroidota bacterium]
MSNLQNLSFSYNWNNKLYCKSWTTLRLYNSKKYAVGANFEVYFKPKGKERQYLGTAELVTVRKTRLSSLNEFVARLDTGYNLEKTVEIFRRMYPNQEDPELSFCLFRWVRIQPGCLIDLKTKKAKT